MDASSKISKARTQLLLDRRFVFWATIGLYLKPEENKGIPTMATDGFSLYYNPEFVDKLTNNELMFVLAHEAGHCALGHHLRRQGREGLKWNIAADYALNLLLTDYSKDLKPPEGCLLDQKYKGMSSEEIYVKLQFKVWTLQPDGTITDEKGKTVGKLVGDVQDGQGKDGDGEKRWDIILKQAAATAKSQGFLPGQFEGLLEPLTPKVDLHSMLRHLFSMTTREDWTWARVDRKHVYRGMYLPGMHDESIGDILVGVDTSGSVDDKMLAKFIGILNVVMTDLKPRVVYLVECDARVQKVTEYHAGEMLPERVKVHGRGGTCMRPIWEWAKDKQLTAAVVCSDFQMGASDFGENQTFPVLWVTTGTDAKAPWGTTVKLED